MVAALAEKIETGLTEASSIPPLSEIEMMERALSKLKSAALQEGAALADNATRTTGEAAPPATGRSRRLQRGNVRHNQGSQTMADSNPSDTSLAHNTSNLVTFDELLAFARESGVQEAKGKDSLPHFLLKITEGAFLQVLDNVKDKYGPGVNDAAKLAEARFKAQTGSNIFDRKVLKIRQQVNRVNTMIKLGMWPKGGPGEPLTTLNSLITMRDKAAKAGRKVQDAANSMLNYARAQTKSDHVLAGADLEKCFLTAEHDKPTEEDFWAAMRKKLQNAKNGKGLEGAADIETCDKIISQVTKRLKAIATAKAPAGPSPTP